MARITVEQKWWSDPRRSKLIRLFLGDTRQVDGLALEMWKLAQEHWQSGRQLVPVAHFKSVDRWDAFVDAGLAEIRGHEVYIHGSVQYLEWTILEKERRVRGGQKSAQRPRDENGRLLPSNIEDSSSSNPSEIQVEPGEATNIQVSGSGSGSKKKNTTTSTQEKEKLYALQNQDQASLELREEQTLPLVADKSTPEAVLNPLSPNSGRPLSPLQEEVTRAYDIWCKTLQSFGVSAPPMNSLQENSLARAIQTLGFETVCLALEGQRYEQATENWSPSKQLSIERVLHRNPHTGVSHWEKLMNLALAERAKRGAKEEARKKAEAIA